MDLRLLRNGAFLCDLVPSVLHAGMPKASSGNWHSCTLVTRYQIIPSIDDLFEVVSVSGASHVFEISSSRMGSEGWEAAGRVLF